MATTIHTLAYKITSDTAGFSRGVTATKRELADAKRVMRATETPIQKFQQETGKLDNLLGKGAITTAQYNTRLKQLRQEYPQAQSAARRFAMGVQSLVRSKLAAIGATAAMAAGLRRLSRTALDFDRAMADSLSIMEGVTARTRSMMETTARQVAFHTKFSATEAAEAYQFLAAAGLDAERSLAALPVTAQFAAAGSFDLALATDLLTDAMSALGMSSDDAGENMRQMKRAGDVLARGSTLANASIRQLSESLTNKAGPALRAANKDIAEGVAVLLAMADQGSKGAEAGTQLATVLTDLQVRARLSAEAFRELEIEVFEAAGEMRRMSDILRDFETAIEGMGTKQRGATIAMLGFNKQSMSTLNSLIGLSDNVREFEDRLGLTGDAMNEIATKRMTDLDRAIQQNQAIWQAYGTEVGRVVNTLLAGGGAAGQGPLGELLAFTFDLASGARMVGSAWRAFFLQTQVVGLRLLQMVVDLVSWIPGLRQLGETFGAVSDAGIDSLSQSVQAELDAINDRWQELGSGQPFREELNQMRSGLGEGATAAGKIADELERAGAAIGDGGFRFLEDVAGRTGAIGQRLGEQIGAGLRPALAAVMAVDVDAVLAAATRDRQQAFAVGARLRGTQAAFEAVERHRRGTPESRDVPKLIERGNQWLERIARAMRDGRVMIAEVNSVEGGAG